MRGTVSLDDELLRRAQEYSGLSERTALIREALKALIEREAAQPGIPGRDDARPGRCATVASGRPVILADANIWIDFSRSGKPEMRELLERNQIVRLGKVADLLGIRANLP